MEEKTKRKKIFNSRPLFYGFLALMLAICVSRYLFAGDVKYIVFVSIVLAVFFAYCIIWKRLKTLLCIFLIFVFGLGWFFVGQAGFVGRSYDQKVQVVGRIGDDLTFYGNYRAQAVLKDVKINGRNSKNISLSIMFDEEGKFEEGDVISFEAFLENNHLFSVGNFNLTAYRNKTPYSASVDMSDVTVEGNRLSADEKVRLAVKKSIYTSMGKENGSVAYAVLFGNKVDVDSQVKENYKTSGIIHLLTVSGLHVTFLISLLGFLLNKCKIKRWLNFIICFAFLGVYAWLCGWTPSVLRAGIMGLVLLFTKITGKCYDNLSSLGLAGVIILLISPLSALDNGFLMSFFCVGGIFIISPWLSRFLRKIFPKFVAESFAISIASQIMILPFMAVFFSEVNLLSFFVNLIVVPFFSVLYPLLFVSTLLTLVMPFCGFLLKGCCFGFSFIAETAKFFSSTSLVVKTAPIDIFICLFLFSFLFLVARFFMASKRIKAVCCSSVFALCGIFMVLSCIPVQPKTTVSFCNSYGDCTVLLTSRSGQIAIVDVSSYQQIYRLMQQKRLDEIDNYFQINEDIINESVVQDFDVENIISLNDYADNEKAMAAQKNQVAVVGDFAFEYVAEGDELLGLEIVFDEVNLFVLYQEILSDQALDALNDRHYDVVFVGKNGYYAKYFDNDFTYGLYSAQNVDYNYNKHGNMGCEIKNKKFVWRCLD